MGQVRRRGLAVPKEPAHLSCLERRMSEIEQPVG